MTRAMPFSLLASLTLTACNSPDLAFRALLDAHDADTQLPLSSITVDEWSLAESCRPHLCHLHKRVLVVAPGGESLVVIIAPAVSDGKPVAVATPSKGWDASGMPPEVRAAFQAAIR